MNDYIEHLEYQRNLLRLMEQYLQSEKMNALPEMQMSYVAVLPQCRELAKSLEIMEKTLKEYLEKVQNTAIRFQKQCQEIELPVFLAVD